MISLTRKIINQIEQKQEIFKGLNGLRITELKKIVKPVNETTSRSNSGIRSDSFIRPAIRTDSF